MIRIAALLLCTGCELIADIPNASAIKENDGGVVGDGGGDDGGGDSDAMVMPACADATCPSQVCRADTTCEDPAKVVYAAPTGSGVACSLAMPCSLDTGFGKMTAATPVLKLLPGTYTRTAQTNYGGADSVTMYGVGAKIVGVPDPNGMFSFYPLFSTSSGSLTIVGAEFDLQGTIAATCTGGTIGMSRVNVHAGFSGLFTNGPCTVKIDRSNFHDNNLYALSFNTDATVDITNTLFVANNSANTTGLGAIFFSGANGSLTHSTFLNNGGDYAAVRCSSSTVTLSSLVLWGNPQNSGIEPACTVSYSIMEPGYNGGANNSHADPQLDATGHLSASSPARGMADPALVQAFDYDGQPRPQPLGSRADSGADEVP